MNTLRTAIALTVLTLAACVQFVLAEEQVAEGGVKMGTDPRDFAPKFMPYYRFTELENGYEQQDFTLFGLYAFTSKFAMTYEIPIAREGDISETSLKDPTTGECGIFPSSGTQPGGGGSPGPFLPSGNTAEGDCKEVGVGDMNLRFMVMTDWQALGGDWMYGVQLDLPTASTEELSTESFNIAPMLTYINDIEAWPGPGAFFALMNFYFFDAYKDSHVSDTSRYVGRWFVMLPLTKPGPGLLDGLYLLPEMQPVYDFEEEHFSFWIGPEVGKMLAPGVIAYAKPGWGSDPEEQDGDRKFTFEVGVRYFMK